MANQAAWQAGMDLASKSGKKTSEDSTDPKDSGKKRGSPKGGGSAGGGSGGGNPWSILTVLKKSIGNYKNGGRVKKTGLALVHKGEYVVPAKHRTKASRKRSGHKGSVVKP